MMIKEKNLTNAEKKRIESLDKRIEKIQNKIAAVSYTHLTLPTILLV